MTSLQQRAELHRQIWQIANDVRGSVDGWDFKQYVLGALFYRFISENFVSYIEAGDDSIRYAALDDGIITDDIKDDAVRTKGLFYLPQPALLQCGSESKYQLQAECRFKQYFCGDRKLSIRLSV